MLDRSFFRLLVLAAFGCAPGVAVMAGCGSKTVTVVPPAPSCDSSKCAAQNECIPETDATGKSVTACRRTCTSQNDPQNGCPFNYTCRLAADGTTTYCSEDTVSYTQGPGQWGASCKASGGIANNSDCDVNDQFWCYGTSPGDANAYCTQFQCNTDRDCAAGFYCGNANVQPNVQTAAFAVGQVQKVCLRRNYCAPCAVDLDCPASLNGTTQHCVSNSDGSASYCTPECQQSSECNYEATCVSLGTGSPSVCVPRAGTCVGDGSLCSPCLSDADCPNGACVQGEFTTEHMCSVTSTSACSQGKGGCPASDPHAKGGVLCDTGVYQEMPPNQCVGTFELGGQPSPGCYTPPRG